MKSYLLSILAVSLASALLLHLLPEKAAFQKSLKFLAALLLLLLLLSPLVGAKKGLLDFFSGDWASLEESLKDSYEEKSQESLLSHSKDYVEKLIKEKLVKSFSLREQDLNVRLIAEDGKMTSVVLLLSGKAIWQDSAKLEDFVNELTGLPCSSVIE